MRDKLFWIALVIAGFYLFNRMNTQASSQTEIPIEQTQDRQQERQQEANRNSVEEPHFGDQDAPLRLPQKEGQTRQETRQQNNQEPENYSEQTRTEIPDLQKQNKDTDISLGEYGSISLPKKNGNDSNSGNTGTLNSSTESKTITLNPNTKRGEGILREINNEALAVLDGTQMQVSSLNNSEVYLDENSFCSINSGSNNVIYVMNSGQLILTGNGNNNTIYYAEGSSIRNGINGTNNQLIPLKNISFK